MVKTLKNWFSKENLIYAIIFIVSIIGIVVSRIFIGFDSVLWISDIASITGVLYVINLAKHNASSFVFNIISTTIITVVCIIQKVWLTAFISSVINIPNLIYGLITWIKNEKNNQQEKNLKTMSKKTLIISFVCLAIVAAVLTVILWLLDGNLFYIDGIYSSLCVVGIILSTRMYIEQYYFFIPCNFLGILLYSLLTIQNVNNIPTIILNCVYAITTTIGYFNWRKLSKQSKLINNDENLQNTKTQNV